MYHKEAEEFDREFIDKYDEDLNGTLVFVGFFLSCLHLDVLSRFAGRVVFCRDFDIHLSAAVSAAARSEQRHRRSPPRPPLQDG